MPDPSGERPPAAPHPQSVPVLPVTWRPRRTRAVVYTIATVVVVTTAVVAAILPRTGDRAFGLVDRLAFVGLGLVIAAGLHMLGRPKLVADADGLTVRNLLRGRRLRWSEVVAVTLRTGDPWALLHLTGGDAVPVMAIQGSNGRRARDAVAQLQALHAERTGSGPSAR